MNRSHTRTRSVPLVAAIVAAIVCVVLACAGADRTMLARAQRGPATPITLSIVGTNDLHGGLLPRDGRGGVELFAGYVNNLRAARARDGGAVVLVDAGDMFQGTLESNLSEGAPVVAVYNALGYAAAAIGNHEFDFGPVGPAQTPASPKEDPRGALKARAAEAIFPFLAANLIDTTTGRPVDWPNVKPSVVLDVAGINVGIIGVMTEEALSTTIETNTRELRIAPLAATIVSEANALRRGGATVVIVAAHAGGRCTRFDSPGDLSACDAQSSEIVSVARRLPAGLVDVIMSGHTHAGMAHLVQGIRVAQAFSGGAAFSRIDLTVDRRTGLVLDGRIFPPRDICGRVVQGTLRCDPAAPKRPLVSALYEGAPIAPDARIARVLAPTVERVRELKATPLGVVLDTPIRRRGSVESPLGNLFTDALLASTPGADVAINNTDGGLRADLPSGTLTFGWLYEVYPFDNRTVSLKLSGAELRRVFDVQLRRAQVLPGTSGVRVEARCATGRLQVTMLRPNGRPIRDDEPLVVVTTEFLATGGDAVLAPILPSQGFAIPADAPIARALVADWFRRRGGRLREADFVQPDRPRWVYPGTLPVRCGAA
jgi:2',3'-cyclic-nucleotide 2'-phosphodiesterase (5'-nucleotidase family)